MKEACCEPRKTFARLFGYAVVLLLPLTMGGCPVDLQAELLNSASSFTVTVLSAVLDLLFAQFLGSASA